MTVEPEQLPLRLKTVWVQQTESRLYLESGAADVLRVRRVEDLDWESDPVTLEAEYS